MDRKSTCPDHALDVASPSDRVRRNTHVASACTSLRLATGLEKSGNPLATDAQLQKERRFEAITMGKKASGTGPFG